MAVDRGRRGGIGGISLGGILVIIGIIVALIWSLWLGLIIVLIGLIAFGGFVRGRCADGREKGLVLVRSIWRADVTLLPWRPEHEIPFHRTVPASELARYLWTEPGAEPIYARAAREAGLTLPN